MGRLRVGLVAVLCSAFLAVLLAGCAGGEQGEESQQGGGTEGSGAANVRTVREGTGGGAADGGGADGDAGGGAGGDARGGTLRVDERAVGEDGRFVVEPTQRGGEGMARTIREVRFGRQEGYERLVVEFGSGDGPAERVPVWFLASPEGDSSLRVEFPGVSETEVAQGDLPGELMDSFYVSRRPAGEAGYLLEVLSPGAFSYRVTELRDPARLILDYRQEDSAFVLPQPATSERVVLLQPREGVIVGRDLLVSGYSRDPELPVTVSGPGGRTLARGTATTGATDPEPWAYFEETLRIPRFEGRAVVRVGGGGDRGVEASVIYGGGTGDEEPEGRRGGGNGDASGG